ncbi:Uncharacterized protein FKW44_007526, partial [Caligus rogercresseyi]
MGQSESSDLRLMYEKVSDFAIQIRSPDKLNINALGNNNIRYYRFKHQSSTFKFHIRGRPFSHKGKSTLDFKVIFLKILNDLYEELGMVPFISSDLSLIHDNSTVFFKTVKRYSHIGKYACIAPSGIDSLYIILFPPAVVSSIKNAIETAWGIDSIEEKRPHCIRVKMRGSPWRPGVKGEYATALTRLILNIFNILQQSMYRFVTNISMKGNTDDMFFRYDSSLPPLQYGSPSLTDHIHVQIDSFWKGGVSDVRMHNDALEIKVKGSPWKATSIEAAGSRVLVSMVLREIRRLGYKTHATLDISRRSNDKSLFVFEGGSDLRVRPPLNIKWTCLYFCGRNKLMLVGVQTDVLLIIQDSLMPLKKDNGTRIGDVHVWKLNSN